MNEKFDMGLCNNSASESVWDSRVVEALIIRCDIRDAEVSAGREIHSERDLVVSILSFLKSGIGGERFVSSSAIIEQFSQNFAMEITLGGTSVRSAIAMRKLGYTSALHLVTDNEHVRRLIPPDSPYVCSNATESAYPHLVVQFGKDTCVKAGDIDSCTRRANRIIHHNDRDNILLHFNEDSAARIP